LLADSLTDVQELTGSPSSGYGTEENSWADEQYLTEHEEVVGENILDSSEMYTLEAVPFPNDDLKFLTQTRYLEEPVYLIPQVDEGFDDSFMGWPIPCSINESLFPEINEVTL